MSTFEFSRVSPDFHSVIGISLGQLITEGFDPFGDPNYSKVDWFTGLDASNPNSDQQQRFEMKFKARYWSYDISITPILAWRNFFTSKLLEVMPKYKYAYTKLAEGTDLFADWDEYGKSRHVFSEFPASQLAPENQDYASTANDRQFETIHDGNFLEKFKYLSDYNDIDVMLLDDMGVLFSCLMSVSANGI